MIIDQNSELFLMVRRVIVDINQRIEEKIDGGYVPKVVMETNGEDITIIFMGDELAVNDDILAFSDREFEFQAWLIAEVNSVIQDMKGLNEI